MSQSRFLNRFLVIVIILGSLVVPSFAQALSETLALPGGATIQYPSNFVVSESDDGGLFFLDSDQTTIVVIEPFFLGDTSLGTPVDVLESVFTTIYPELPFDIVSVDRISLRGREALVFDYTTDSGILARMIAVPFSDGSVGVLNVLTDGSFGELDAALVVAATFDIGQGNTGPGNNGNNGLGNNGNNGLGNNGNNGLGNNGNNGLGNNGNNGLGNDGTTTDSGASLGDLLESAITEDSTTNDLGTNTGGTTANIIEGNGIAMILPAGYLGGDPGADANYIRTELAKLPPQFAASGDAFIEDPNLFVFFAFDTDVSSGLLTNVNVSSEVISNYSVEQYAADLEAEIGNLIVESATGTVNNYPAARIVLNNSVDLGNNESVQLLQLMYILQNGENYNTVVFTTPASEAEQRMGIFEDAVTTIAIGAAEIQNLYNTAPTNDVNQGTNTNTGNQLVTYSGRGIQIDLPASYIGGDPIADQQLLQSGLQQIGSGFLESNSYVFDQADLYRFFAFDDTLVDEAWLPLVGIIAEPFNGTPGEYFDGSASGFPDTMTVLERQSSQIGPYPAELAIVQQDSGFEVMVQQLMVIVVDNGVAYSIIYTVPDTVFAERLPTFQASVQTFRVTQ